LPQGAFHERSLTELVGFAPIISKTDIRHDPQPDASTSHHSLSPGKYVKTHASKVVAFSCEKSPAQLKQQCKVDLLLT
jgi:hypothetical protein